jgi:leader peptidase (prepilin peptidase)/N-methyltransferase
VFYVLSFFLGASVGSFVQVIATRLNVAKVVSGRSKCLSCGETLRFADLIPLISYLFLRGKCRYCKSPYGISALLVEVVYGIIFVLLYHFILSTQTTLIVSSMWLVYYSLLFITLGVIALYDWKHTYIPLSYLFVYCVLTLVMLLIRYIDVPLGITLLSPFIVSFPFLVLWLITKGKGLGFGDVLLFLGVGAFFGTEQGLVVLLLSIWMGALYGIFVYMKLGKDNARNKMMPFVPFIMIAFIVVLFTDIDIFSIADIFA